ncbi:MAG: hypothetical protein LCH84_07050 [Gemmatimonadetes bacterium]|nr:hypothetical protein [Gemmatimonadota bacterium]
MAADDFDPPGRRPDDDADDPQDDAHDEAADDASDDDAATGPFAGDAEAEGRPAVFVTTREPVDVRIAQLDDPRAPESSALAAYIGDRMIARSAMPAEAIARLIELHLFDTPVPLGLFAFEEAPGLQCRLFALVPRALLEAEAHADEPWKASVPSYESSLAGGEDEDEEDDDEEDDEDEEEVPFETILLGHIVRFEKDRKHPDDLAAEAVDILQRIIHGAESLQDADRKAIDDLLGSL